jgi:hypothetical protein
MARRRTRGTGRARTATGEVRRGQIAPADRQHLRAWLARFAGWDDVAFAVEGCAGWRYVAEELGAAGGVRRFPASLTGQERALPGGHPGMLVTGWGGLAGRPGPGGPWLRAQARLPHQRR